MTVDIIIVHYQDLTSLEVCLNHLAKQVLPPANVMIVDNSDDLPELKVTGLTLEIIRPKANLGFAAACNLAAKRATADWLAFLNADAFAQPDWLAQLAGCAAKHPDCSCFSSRQLFQENPSLLDGTGDCYHFSGLYWRRGHKQAAMTDFPSEVFSASGASMLVRRNLFLSLGGFDQSFFAYGEDVDFGFRLRLAGHDCRYCKDAVVHHVGYSSSGGRHSNFSLYHGHRNLVWVFFKNMPLPLLLITLPWHVLLTIITLIKFSLQGQGSTIVRAKWDGFRQLAEVLQARQAIQPKRRITLIALWRLFQKDIRR